MRGGPSKDELNRLLRAFMWPRRHRALTAAERAEYEALVTAWTQADEEERPMRADVVKAA